MKCEDHDVVPIAEERIVTAAMVREMLASLQEAVVTTEVEARRALLKAVIAQLQDVLTPVP